MSTHRAVPGLVALACAAALAGCFANAQPEVPASWLRAARSEGPEADGYGAWISLYDRWSRSSRVTGELIACDRDSTWVLAAEGLVAVATRRVRALTVCIGRGSDGEVESWSKTRAVAEELRRWARFPQGIPAGLDRALIRPRPWVEP